MKLKIVLELGSVLDVVGKAPWWVRFNKTIFRALSAFFYLWNFGNEWNLKITQIKWFWRVLITKNEGKKKKGKNPKISIVGFQSGAMNIQGLFF